MHAAIKKLIDTLNEAWQREDWAALEACYHPDVVLMPPDAGEPIRGRDAVLDTYRDFCRAATLERFTVTELEAFPFDATHVVHMRFEVDYGLDSERYRDQGLEIYVLTAADAGPLRVVWRQQQLLNQESLG